MTSLSPVRKALNLTAPGPHNNPLPFTPIPDAFYACIDDVLYSYPYALGSVPGRIAVQGKLVAQTFHELGLRCVLGPVTRLLLPSTVPERVVQTDERPIGQGVNWIWNCDALTLLKALPDGSVSLIPIDPPYFGVKDEDWDNQWATADQYLDWLSGVLTEIRRVLKPNGSLYVFASLRMAARVEILIGEYFNVLTRITWNKPPYSTKAEMFDKDSMRSFFSSSEAIIFAEQHGADKPYSEALIDGNSTYWGACETAKRSVFGDYLKAEFNRAGVTNRQIAALFPSASGGLTGCVSNWMLGYNCPTSDQYIRMRDYLNKCGGEFLRTEYEELRTEYEELRTEYEELRTEYEELRRPFNMTECDPYTDVWTFRTVNTYPGKHPCEKPAAVMEHIIRISSRPGDLVLDCFMGGGTTAIAARNLGRDYIGCDTDAGWVQHARSRLRLPFEPAAARQSAPLSDLPMFAEVGP